MTVKSSHLYPTFLMPWLREQGSNLVCLSLDTLCTALYSGSQIHASAELDRESGKQQQAAASNPRSLKVILPTKGKSEAKKRQRPCSECHWGGEGMEPRSTHCTYFMPRQTCLQQVQSRPPQCKSQKDMGSSLNPPMKNRACYLSFLTFHRLRGGENTPLHWLAQGCKVPAPS